MAEIIGLGTEGDTVRVRRVTVSDDTERALTQILEKYSCTYNGKLSINKLLSQIAEGKLKVSRPEMPLFRSPSVPLIELEIEVISNLNGTLAEIAKKIADCEGNIYRARAIENSRNSNLKIELSMSKNSNLGKLTKSLYEIKIGDILEFNEWDKLETLLAIIDPEQKRRYERYKEKDKDVKIEDFFHSKVIDYQAERLVTNVVCTIGFQVVISNQPGTLDKLTHKIAEKRISICSIDIDFNPTEDKNLVNLCLGFSPALDEVSQKIESIQNFMRSLMRNLDFVESVKQSSIEHLNSVV